MGPSSRIWLLIAGVWCVSEIRCYNVHRIENENGQPINVEIDFYSDYDRKRFFDDLNNAQNRKDLNQDTSNYGAVTEPLDPYKEESNDTTPLDSWSVVWYIASFGGLIVFFLIVSCSEWCCRRARRNQENCTRTSTVTATAPDTPPPSYDEFAPPSYESICLGRQGDEKSKYDIYVVPVHALGTIMNTREDAPPSYLSASSGQFVPALTRLDSQVT